MTTSRWVGLIAGALLFAAMLALPAPTGMPVQAWNTAALVLLMAIWWMTQAIPLTATALLPFLALPMFGVMSANDVAGEYYSPILFLILGGAFIALAIERTGLHRRLALAIVTRAGDSAWGLLFAFMAATALLSMIISNTSTTLIMIPIALAVLAAAEAPAVGKVGGKLVSPNGFSGALMMGIAFAASIGGLGTLVGSPTNAIAAGLVNRQLGTEIDFLAWLAYGIPVVLLGIPLCAAILILVQKLPRHGFDVVGARAAIGGAGAWSRPERRLLPVIALVFLGWLALPLLKPLAPDGALTDGTVAIAGALLLFFLPDGTGRPLLTWKEADRAPWGVIMLFGGGLALASGITQSGLATWLGEALEPLAAVPPLVIAAAVVALVILVTEFASNVATASGIMPVVASLALATGVDPMLLAMPAAMAASWGFMLPSGTGPNALAWSTERIELPRMLQAGALRDIAGVPLLVGTAFAVASFL